eukprot:m51a1_g13339 hypothetical protein (209) ;mRNA; f:130-756
MAVMRLDEAAALRSLSPGAAGGRVAPLDVTYITPPGGFRGMWEKNWMPFFHGAEFRMIRFIEPHEVVRCNVPGDGKCEVVASTSWPDLHRRLASFIRNPISELRGSSAVIDRGADYLTSGHVVERGGHYWFFWYTFAKEPPFAITGASRPFRLVADMPTQFLSGAVLVEDWYLVTYSAADKSTQAKWIPRCQVDEAVKALRPGNTTAV